MLVRTIYQIQKCALKADEFVVTAPLHESASAALACLEPQWIPARAGVDGHSGNGEAMLLQRGRVCNPRCVHSQECDRGRNAGGECGSGS